MPTAWSSCFATANVSSPSHAVGAKGALVLIRGWRTAQQRREDAAVERRMRWECRLVAAIVLLPIIFWLYSLWVRRSPAGENGHRLLMECKKLRS